MPTFEWKGTARNGQTQTGVLVADSKDAVIAMMRRQQIVVTAVKEMLAKLSLSNAAGPGMTGIDSANEALARAFELKAP